MSTSVEVSHNSEKKNHPWRRCLMGKHFVRKHSLHVPPSKKNPDGIIATRHEHCAANRSHRDELSFDVVNYHFDRE